MTLKSVATLGLLAVLFTLLLVCVATEIAIAVCVTTDPDCRELARLMAT